MKDKNKTRFLLYLTGQQIDFINQKYENMPVDIQTKITFIIGQLMSGQLIDASEANGSTNNNRPVGRPKREYPQPQKETALDDPAGNYFRLTPGQIEDVNNADISFVSMRTTKLNVGFWQRDNKGNIVNGNLPYSMIEICTVDEAKRLPPSIKEILDSKFQDDPTGGISADERKRIIAAERDSAFVPKEAETMKCADDGEQG